MPLLFSEWQGGLFSWRPARKADWDEDDWDAWRKYSTGIRKDFQESCLDYTAMDEEIFERQPDGSWRSIETGEFRSSLMCLEDQAETERKLRAEAETEREGI